MEGRKKERKEGREGERKEEGEKEERKEGEKRKINVVEITTKKSRLHFWLN